MPIHVLIWRPIACKDVRGADIELDFPTSVDVYYRGRLLSAIFQMPRGCPISLDDAVRLTLKKRGEAFDRELCGTEPGHYHWYSTHFVEWISSLGYHIEITGDEFDIATPSRYVI